MTIEEKLAYVSSGKAYDGLDADLMAVEANAAALTDQLNHETDPEAQARITKELFGAVGAGPFISPTFRCGYGRNIFAGDHFFVNYDCMILDGAKVTIGDNVLFGPKVGLYTTNHVFDPSARAAGGCYARPITIGDNCWLAANVTVLPGVTIGAGTIIGAGSVVTKDIPENVIAAGNPCRVIRPITAQDRATGSDFMRF